MNPIKSQIAANREIFRKKHFVFSGATYTMDKQKAIIETIDTLETSLLQTAIAAVEGMKTEITTTFEKDPIQFASDIRQNNTLSAVVELLKGGITE